ncbi:hypothetical protein [Aurantimonas coralicida]|uniref:hypothetical protein n=1 Tax=Aurantimonas coralicida TaxID=182270 RepID=UPI001E2901F9|nr:hypothetical protein [Aurantimonas coralicida]MCD1644514.1 hypothetical protein [Aurantimonas coralicida]
MTVVPFARYDRQGSRDRCKPAAVPARICAMPASTLVAYTIRRSRAGAARGEIAPLIGRLRQVDDPAAAVLADHLEQLRRIRMRQTP